MGDHHHGHTAPGQLLHDLQNLAHHFRIQGRGGLVKEHDLRLHHHGPDNGDPLLLTAGQLNGIGVGPILQTHPLEQGQGLFRGGFLGLPQHLHGGQDHVVQNGLVGEQVKVLKHHAHFLPVQVDIHLFRFALLVDEGLFGNVDAVEQNLTVGGDLQQVQTPQQGGFAGAGGADDHHHVSFVDVNADIVQGLQCALVVVFFQVLDLDQLIVCRHGASSFQSVQ